MATSRPARAVAAAVGVLASLGLSACGLGTSPSTSSSDQTAPTGTETAHDTLAARVPADIREAGTIRMAVDPTYPPFESIAKDGSTLEGLDPDLANAIAARLGLKVTFVPTSFDAVIPALQSKKVDFAMSSIGDTKEREAVVDFATYYWNGTLMLVPKGNPKGVKADMACGLNVGVIRGSLQQSSFLPRQKPACEAAGLKAPIAKAYQTGPQAQLALKSGRIDAVMSDAPTVADVVKKQPEAFASAGPLVKNPNPGGVAFPKGSPLAAPFSEAINTLIKDGTYQEILAKWNLSDIAIDSSEVNGAQS